MVFIPYFLLKFGNTGTNLEFFNIKAKYFQVNHIVLNS